MDTTSIFDLQDSVTGEVGSTRAKFVQLPTLRDVTSTFTGAPIVFQWTNSDNSYVVPDRCYLRMRCTVAQPTEDAKIPGLSHGDPADLVTDNLPNYAPVTNFGHHLWQSCQWDIGGKTVSRIQDFVGQVGALDTRMHASSDWINTVGRDTNFASESFDERRSQIHRQVCQNKPDVAVYTPLFEAALNLNDDASGALNPVAADRYTLTSVGGNTQLVFSKNGAAASTFFIPNVAVKVGDWITWEGADPANHAKRRSQVISINHTTATILMKGNQLLLASNLPGQTADGINDGFRFTTTPPSTDIAARNFEICFQLPLSIWKHSAGIPACSHSLKLMPKTSIDLVKSAFESTNEDVSNISFSVQEMYLHVYEVEGPQVENTSFLLDLEQTMCQSQQITTTQFHQRTVDVSPSTFGLTIAYQDTRVNNQTNISAARFLCPDIGTNTDINGVVTNPVLPTTDITDKLNRFYVQYAGQNYPSPDANPQTTVTDGDYTVAWQDYTVERYYQTMLNSGRFFSSSPESKSEFEARGRYLYFNTPRDATDRSTRVTVAQGWSSLTEAQRTNMALMVFDHSRQVCKITIDGGIVSDVQLQDD